MKAQTYIALIRGINVGGHKKFPKAAQVAMLESLGLKNAQGYIHTGNWVFESATSASALQKIIGEAILKKFSWDIPIIVVSAKEFLAVFENCPFIKEKKEQSYFTLFDSAPSAENIKALQSLKYVNEEFYVTPSCVYTFYAHGAGKAKLTNNVMERKLKVAATSRNYKTMARLLELSS